MGKELIRTHKLSKLGIISDEYRGMNIINTVVDLIRHDVDGGFLYTNGKQEKVFYIYKDTLVFAREFWDIIKFKGGYCDNLNFTNITIAKDIINILYNHEIENLYFSGDIDLRFNLFEV